MRLDTLDYNMAFIFATGSSTSYQTIKQSLSQTNVAVTVHKVHGTKKKVRDLLWSKRPTSIHFSGHFVLEK